MDWNSRNTGQELLKKWLDGDISSTEEMELFDLAESDSMLKEALEGYLGQEVINRPVLPVVVGRATGAEPILVKTSIRRRRWMVYIAAAIVLLIAMTTVLTQSSLQGNKAELTAVEFVLPEMEGLEEQTTSSEDQLNVEALVEDIKNDPPVHQPRYQKPVVEQRAVAIAEETSIQPDESDAMKLSGYELRPDRRLTEKALKDLASITAGNSTESSRENQPEINKEVVADLADKTDKKEAEEVAPADGDIALQFFDYDVDAVLKEEVKQDGMKDNDEPITGYEIDVKSGISPKDMTALNDQSETQDSTEMDIVGLQSKANLTNASTADAGEVQTNMIANNVVINEYKIQKRDITHPPIEDYNSLVREKYKRKANPEVGFYHYKKFLKRATSCLIDEYRNVDYLEEAIIKFRVFRNGDIDFIELFGARNSACVEQVSLEITSGPKWQVADRYESIDVEVPFKVLYPYMY